MKQKYADTIQKKFDKKKNPPPPKQEKPVFFLTRWNRLLWPLFISPVFTLLYAPVNRYVSLPKLGSGRPYEDMNGMLVEDYFSANSLSRILFFLLLITTEFLLIKTTRGISRGKCRCRRIALLIVATVLNLVMGIVFLEFTLWE